MGNRSIKLRVESFKEQFLGFFKGFFSLLKFTGLKSSPKTNVLKLV